MRLEEVGALVVGGCGEEGARSVLDLTFNNEGSSWERAERLPGLTADRITGSDPFRGKLPVRAAPLANRRLFSLVIDLFVKTRRSMSLFFTSLIGAQ